MADIERNLQELQEKTVKESGKEGITINCKETELWSLTRGKTEGESYEL